MTYFDQCVIFLQLEISKYYLNSIFTLNLLFSFERVRLVLTPKRRKKTYQHAGIPTQAPIRTA